MRLRNYTSSREASFACLFTRNPPGPVQSEVLVLCALSAGYHQGCYGCAWDPVHHINERRHSPMNMTAPRIFCIEPDASVLETRCAILRRFGYAAFAVPTSQAEILLASQTFDLILLSATMSGEERRRIATAVGTPELWCWMD